MELPAGRCRHRRRPELQEVLERGRCDVDAVQERVAEKEHEELVVVECDAVVDPWAVVVHLEHALSAHGAVVRAVRLDVRALRAVSDLCLDGPHGAGQVLCDEDLLQRELCVLRGLDPFHLGVGEPEPRRNRSRGREHCLVVGPDEEDEEEVIEHHQKDLKRKDRNTVLDSLHAHLPSACCIW